MAVSMRNRVSWAEQFRSSDIDPCRNKPESLVVGHNLMNGGRLTVQERLTGYGYWDVETGYRSPGGGFWLASGDCDVREYLDMFKTEDEMCDWVVRNSNNLICSHERKTYGWTYEQLMKRENWKPRPAIEGESCE